MSVNVLTLTAATSGGSTYNGFGNTALAAHFTYSAAFGTLSPSSVDGNVLGTFLFAFASSNNSKIIIAVPYSGTPPLDTYIQSVTFTADPGAYNLNQSGGFTTFLVTGTGGQLYKLWQWGRTSTAFPSNLNPFTNGVQYTITLTTLPVTPPIPNVVGDDVSDATAALIASGFVLGTQTLVNSETISAGIILTQSPAAGSTASPGTAVNVTVSLGPVNPTKMGAIKIVAQKANDIQVQFVYSPLGIL